MLKERTISVEDGIITEISFGQSNGAKDLEGVVIPGFVDIHCHGGGGYDLSVDQRGAQFHLAHGTTTLLASFVSEPVDSIISKLNQLELHPNVIGVHLEGPYLAHAHCGAHKPEYLTQPKQSDLEKLVATGKVKYITIAPELPGALAAISYLSQKGVTVAIGHSAASAEIVSQAIANGARLVTHLYNGMNKGYSDPQTLAGFALGDERLGLEVIADGIHVPIEVIRDFIIAASNRLIGITDAAPFAGKSDGEYQLGELPVVVVDGVARLRDGGALAGSTLTMDQAFANMVNLFGLSPVDAVATYCTRPAAYLKQSDVGDIAVGKRANFLVMDDKWALKQVYFAGQLVA